MKPLRVLVVEDVHSDAVLAVRELERAGFTPEWERVDAAPALAEALRRPWDLVLCDFHVPGFGALEALALLSAGGPPCIVVSGSMTPVHVAAVLKAGARDVVAKDALSRLGEAARRVLYR